MRCQPCSSLLPDPVHSGDSLSWLAEALAAVRAEEADDLAARLAEAKLQLAELGALPPGSPQSQQAVSSASDSEQARHWLPRAISDAASHAMYPTAKLRVTQVRCHSRIITQPELTFWRAARFMCIGAGQCKCKILVSSRLLVCQHEFHCCRLKA